MNPLIPSQDTSGSKQTHSAPAIRAAFYARVSSEQQSQAGTIASQVAALRQRIAEDGLVLEQEMAFGDDGYSGATLVRPALERLRDTAAAGAVDRLYISCPDRLARKCSLQMLLIEELSGCGVELVFLNRPIGQTPEDDLLLQMQGAVAEYERAKILERSRRGKLHAARRGSVSVLSQAPYGYTYVSKRQTGGEAQLNDRLEQAPTVRQIFQWVGVEQLSLAEVCRRLHKQGICAPRGGAFWDRTTLLSLLRNPAYQGTAAYGKHYAGPRRPRPRPQRGASEQPRRPRSIYRVPPEKWLAIPVPALVDADLFAAAGRQLDENRRRARIGNREPRFLLQGLLVCSSCGYAYCGLTPGGGNPQGSHDHPAAYAYYRCGGAGLRRELRGAAARTGEPACASPSLRMGALDEAVWRDVRSLLADPGRIEQEFQRRLKPPDGDDAQDPQRRRTAAAAAGARRAIARLIDAYRDGLVERGEFEPRLAAERSRLAKLETEVQSQLAAEDARREMRLVIDSLATFSEQVKTGLADADWQMRRELIRALVKRVEIGPQAIRVVYKVNLNPFDPSPDKGHLSDCCVHHRAFAANSER